jgi:lipoprotein NlpD
MAAKNEKWYNKLRNKYRLVILNDETFEERFTFRLTRMNVLLTFLSLGIIFIIITFFIIAYSPIREYIPGYPTIDQKKELYKLNLVVDSMLNNIRQKDLYLQNIKNIIEDNEEIHQQPVQQSSKVEVDTADLLRSAEDSMLRAEFESGAMYNLYFTEPLQNTETSRYSIRDFNFFRPLDGIITARFDMSERHFGTDIATVYNEAVKATLEGTVLYADWTLETGHVIAIQHQGSLVSVYKHCSVLLKKEGDHTQAGEAIAIAGESGELATGPHLHFELWYDGTPIDPEEYIIFN